MTINLAMGIKNESEAQEPKRQLYLRRRLFKNCAENMELSVPTGHRVKRRNHDNWMEVNGQGF
jgi:hypothetical protein